MFFLKYFFLAFIPTRYGLGFLKVFCQLIRDKNNYKLACGANPQLLQFRRGQF